MTTPEADPASVETISVETAVADGGGLVGVVRFDRPKVNAVNRSAQREMVAAFSDLNDNLDVRAVVFAGTQRVFCAGADLNERKLAATGGSDAGVADFGAIVMTLRNMRVPVIAAISGPAHGGGLEIALACDIRVGSPTANFVASGARVGLIANVVPLAEAIGGARARHMLFTAAPVEAERAESWGLLTEVSDDPEAAALELAMATASRAPMSIEAAKDVLNNMGDLTSSAATTRQMDHFGKLRSSADHAEAVTSFLEKRPPDFKRR